MRHLLHEMRTPIGQIIGYGEMLQEEMEDRSVGRAYVRADVSS